MKKDLSRTWKTTRLGFGRDLIRGKTPTPPVNPKPIINPKRDLTLFALVLVVILTIMGLGVLLNAPSLLMPASHWWFVGVCLLNKTPTNTTYIITVNTNTTLYNIKTTPSNCTITPVLPVTGPAVAQLTCGEPLERVVFVTSGGVVTYNETVIGNCPS